MATYKVPLLESFTWQKPVLDRLTAPPGGESKGDRYLIIAVGSGDWTGKENQIALYNGVDWDYVLPTEGMAIWVSDEDKYYRYDGSVWAIFEQTGPTGPTGPSGPTGPAGGGDFLVAQVFS